MSKSLAHFHYFLEESRGLGGIRQKSYDDCKNLLRELLTLAWSSGLKAKAIEIKNGGKT